MGRYVTGNGFEYKFAFADQSSTFGEVIEELCKDTDNYVSRYIGDDGEIVKLIIDDAESLVKNIEDFAKYEQLTPEQEEKWSKMELKMGNTYWDKVMMKRFLEQVTLREGSYQFDVEY